MSQLTQLIKEYWEKIEYIKWDYLFKQWDKDTSIFYIESWNVILQKDKNNVFTLSKWEIFWEKNFIEKNKRSLSAFAWSKLTCYEFKEKDLDKLSNEQVKLIFSSLSLFLSQRVYSMNEILYNINMINDKILELDWKQLAWEDIVHIFSSIINVKNYFVIRLNWWEYQQILSNNSFTSEIRDLIEFNLSKKLSIRVWKNYIFIYSNGYIYLLLWDIKLDSYILNNLLLYNLPLFWHLWFSFERNSIEKFLKRFKFS